MKRFLLAALLAVAVGAGASSAASAANPNASCVGIGSSSLAGEPGARAAVQAQVDAFAAEIGARNRGAVYSSNAHQHLGSVEACFGSG